MNSETIYADTMHASAKYWRRMAAGVMVLITFLARSAYDLLKAYHRKTRIAAFAHCQFTVTLTRKRASALSVALKRYGGFTAHGPLLLDVACSGEPFFFCAAAAEHV